MSDCERLGYRLDGITPIPRFPSPGAAVMVGQVISAASSIAVGKFLMVNPVSVMGAETEGAAGVTVANGSVTVPVYLIGPGLPQTGDMLICRFIDFRWVAERKTSHASGTNGCNCTWPRVLSYKGSVGQAAASFYFNNAPNAGFPEPVYTLTYGPRPSDIPLNLQLLWFSYPGGVADPYYITMPANAWFSPPIPGFVGGTPTNIYFYMWVKNCSSNVMVIDAPYGLGAAPGATRGAGNNVVTYLELSCTPFTMSGSRTGNPVITGTHGSDDIVPDITGAAGFYSERGSGSDLRSLGADPARGKTRQRRGLVAVGGSVNPSLGENATRSLRPQPCQADDRSRCDQLIESESTGSCL